MRDERRLNEEREAIRSKHQQYAGYSRGDMLGMHSPAAFGSPSLRRSVRRSSFPAPGFPLVPCTLPGRLSDSPLWSSAQERHERQGMSCTNHG